MYQKHFYTIKLLYCIFFEFNIRRYLHNKNIINSSINDTKIMISDYNAKFLCNNLEHT